MDYALIDTNVLIYGYNKSEPQKNKIAADLLEKCWQRKITYAISMQNLSEFYFNITKKVKKPLDEITAYFLVIDFIFLPSWKVLRYNEGTILLAMEISKTFEMPYWDSLLAATMKENGITRIYTENEKDFKVPWIKAINPFKK